MSDNWDVPEFFTREVCAGRLAELAWTRGAAERELLLRVSFYLSPDPKEQAWSSPSALACAMAARWLRTLSEEVASAPTFVASALLGQRTMHAREARTLMAAVFIAGAELLEQGVPREG
jgi:hypothetical protein